jgi:hypothetical protein
MPDIPQEQTITLPVADWQTILAGLYELPGKFGFPVITRLQAELTKPAENSVVQLPLKGVD